MKDRSVDSPEPIMRLAWSYFASRPFFDACRLDLFTLVGRGINNAALVSEAAGVEEKIAALLLESMVSLQLLVVDRSGNHANTSLAAEYLSADSPSYIGDLMDLLAKETAKLPSHPSSNGVQTARTGELPNRQGMRPRDTQIIHGTAVHGLSSAAGMAFGYFFDFSGKSHLLDLAGGIAATVICAALRNPNLKVTVLDWPTVCAIGRTYVESIGLNDRISFVQGEIFVSEYPTEPDIHYCSNTLHGFSPEHCKLVMNKSLIALPLGGQLIFHDRVLKHVSPPYSPILNAGMLVLDQHGLTHAVEDYREWMLEVGFSRVDVFELAGIPGFVCGTK